MKNWSYHKHGWSISWFNLRNLPEDNYFKLVNENYRENPKTYFRKIFHFLYKEYGIEIAHTWENSHLLWQTPKNIYWFIFRDSGHFMCKGKWCLRFLKTLNDHISCG